MIRAGAQLSFDVDEERELVSSRPIDFALLDDQRVHSHRFAGQEVTEQRTCFRCGAPATSTWPCPTGRLEPACDEHACCGNDRPCRHCPLARTP